jgi:hypothetical protein
MPDSGGADASDASFPKPSTDENKPVSRALVRQLEETNDRGLVARWSKHFGFVSLHDPTAGTWHDLQTKDAPDWARSEAFRRKALYRDGDRQAYQLTSYQMERIWEAEQGDEEDVGIVDDHPLPGEE